MTTTNRRDLTTDRPRPTTVTIRRNSFDEYEVPTGYRRDGTLAIYYTDDRDDAKDTARHYAGVFDGAPEPHLVIRRGTYTTEEA